MLTVYDQIQELHLEMKTCAMTRRERTRAHAEMKKLIAEQAMFDRAFDAVLADEAPPD
jgi:hypothetical protein